MLILLEPMVIMIPFMYATVIDLEPLVISILRLYGAAACFLVMKFLSFDRGLPSVWLIPFCMIGFVLSQPLDVRFWAT